MQIGILAHCFGKMAFSKLAETIGNQGFSYIQLALSKAFSDVDSGLGKLSPGLAQTIRGTYQQHGVRIASLGCYINMIETNQMLRRAEIDRFKEHIRIARDIGTSIVATETGNPARDVNTEVAWETLLETVRELAEEASRWGVTIGIEPALGHIIDSVETMVQLLEEVPSLHIGVVFDPVNVLHKGNISQQETVIEQAFDALGSRIVLIHAKDFIFSKDGDEKIYTPLGEGLLNYDHFMRLLHKHKPLIDITLEGLQPEQIPSSMAFIQSFARSSI